MLQLRASLLDIKPEIWRVLLVDPRFTMAQLHTALQYSFGWTNEHLHFFRERNGRTYKTETQIDRHLNRIAADHFGDPLPDVIDERKVTVAEVFRRKRKDVYYEYDMGDSWGHRIVSEGFVDAEKVEYHPHTFVARGRGMSGKVRAAICVAGERAAPPENSGGVFGYCDVLALRKRAAEGKRLSRDDRLVLEWLEGWDPERIELWTINENLGRMRVKKAFQDRPV